MPWHRRAPAALALGCALAFLRCGHEPLAGSSVTTGNPTEIQVSFTGENGPVALTGRVDVYGATQVPIPGFRPEPLARFDVARQEEFRLASEDVAAIPDSLWPVGSLEGDSLAHFHLVIAGAGQGAIVRDLSLRRKDGEFKLEDMAVLSRQKMVARLEVGIEDLVEYRAYMDPQTLDSSRFNYLFLPGTAYAVEAEDGLFRFPSLPRGPHAVAFISLPKSLHNTWPEDSTNVYGVDHPLELGSVDTLKLTDINLRLELPEQYKP